MSPADARLTVVWMSGPIRDFAFGKRRVLVDGRSVAVVGEDIAMPCGVHRVAVRSNWARSNDLEIMLDAGAATILECQPTLAALATIVWGLLLGAIAAVLAIAVVSRLLQPPLHAATTLLIVGLWLGAMVSCSWLAVQAWARGLEWTGHHALDLRASMGHAAVPLAPGRSVTSPIMGIVYFGAALLGLFVGAALAPRAAAAGILACWMLGGAFCGLCGSGMLVTAVERSCGVRLATPLGFAVCGTLAGFALLPAVVAGPVTARHLWMPAAAGLIAAAVGSFREWRRWRSPGAP